MNKSKHMGLHEVIQGQDSNSFPSPSQLDNLDQPPNLPTTTLPSSTTSHYYFHLRQAPSKVISLVTTSQQPFKGERRTPKYHDNNSFGLLAQLAEPLTVTEALSSDHFHE